MDENLKGQIKKDLTLWQYLPVLKSIYDSCADVERDSLVMAVLEEVAVHAWEHCRHASQIESLRED